MSVLDNLSILTTNVIGVLIIAAIYALQRMGKKMKLEGGAV